MCCLFSLYCIPKDEDRLNYPSLYFNSFQAVLLGMYATCTQNGAQRKEDQGADCRGSRRRKQEEQEGKHWATFYHFLSGRTIHLFHIAYLDRGYVDCASLLRL